MIWQLYCCLTSLCVYRQINSCQPPSGYLSITRSASGGSARDLRRQQAQGVPGADKKIGSVPTGAVCRSCTLLACLHQSSPARRENRNGFPGSQVFGAGTLPVGFQGRSALIAPKGAKSRNLFSDDSRMSQIVTNCHKFSFFSFRALDIFSFFGHNIQRLHLKTMQFFISTNCIGKRFKHE